MPKDKAILVPTSTLNQIKLDNPWPVDIDILIQILEWFEREDLANFQLVCRFNNALISEYRDHLNRGLAPLDCVTIINATRARILPGLPPISVSDLHEHWPHRNETFRRLCAVRSLSYFYAPRSVESDKFVQEIVKLTFAALKQPERGFFKNSYLRDLVILMFCIEVYSRTNNFIVLKSNSGYKLSDLLMNLFKRIYSNITDFTQINYDPASICFHSFIKSLANRYDEQFEKLFIDFGIKLNVKTPNYRTEGYTNPHACSWRRYLKQPDLQIASSILLPFFINPSNFSRILPNRSNWNEITSTYVQTLCKMSPRRSNQLLMLDHGLMSIIVNNSKDLNVNDFFNQIDTFLNNTEITVYLSMFCYYYRKYIYHGHLDVKIYIKKVQEILCIPPKELQEKINNLLKKLDNTNLYDHAHIILLLLIIRPETNITIELLITLFNNACATCDKSSSFNNTDYDTFDASLITAITYMLFLNIHVINYIVNNQANKDILSLFSKKTDHELASILRRSNDSSYGPLFIFLFSKDFITLKQLSSIPPSTKYELITHILKIIPHE